ncbi:hypothetical protein [Flavivirga spongiicola]|uniref:T9SS C-terminal target domain-containing protein n=1 Tax=Flavivirga spongiicola TaxID=421621 RepID=A0ABU7XUR4_9FLAO|nr:hypothetical protein [Flavivirga sp. MEBiC05379]MDO5979499.1 hypothetical protein [Flavivirga sp. MEBiC05379]
MKSNKDDFNKKLFIMKNFTKIVWLLIVVSGSVCAQQERGIKGTDNWLNAWTEFSPNTVDYGESTHVLTGNITEDITLYKKHTYLLIGNVFVTNNAILSIEPGTVIMGDSKSKATLTITVGSAIIAEGTLTDPIVFTSNKMTKKAGDWGGVIILGDGYTNKLEKSSGTSFYAEIEPSNYKYTNFGGKSLKENSGYISYVRVEYAGGKTKRSNVSNALLLGGVGVKTTINNVMVSYSAGNSFNVIGGAVNLNKMVSYKSKGNDYNFSYGAVCNINNSLAVRSPYISSGESRCINAVSYNSVKEVDFTKKGTAVIAKNVTLLTDTKNLDYEIEAGLIRESIYIGENTNFKIDKSIISGFSKAVILDENIKVNDASLARIQFKNICFNNCNGSVFLNFNDNNENLENWYRNPSFSNVYFRTSHSELFIDLNNSKRPDYRLLINKRIAMNNGSKITNN